MKTWEIGVSSISPNEDDSNIRWTGETVQALTENDACDIATAKGYYRNLRLRLVKK